LGFRDKLRRFEQAAREHLESFVLEDGSRFYYDPVSPEVFLHSMECLEAQGEGKTTFPEPPPVVKAIARAKNRDAAIEKVFDGTFSVVPYDTEALVNWGEFVPRSMVASRELGEPLPDLSE
jgi:hypothetical protein